MTRQRVLSTFPSLVVALGTMVAGAASLGGLQQFGAPYAEVQGRTTRYERAAADARKLLVTFMQEKGVPGLSVAVGVNGDIVWSEGTGPRGRRARRAGDFADTLPQR